MAFIEILYPDQEKGPLITPIQLTEGEDDPLVRIIDYYKRQ